MKEGMEKLGQNSVETRVEQQPLAPDKSSVEDISGKDFDMQKNGDIDNIVNQEFADEGGNNGQEMKLTAEDVKYYRDMYENMYKAGSQINVDNLNWAVENGVIDKSEFKKYSGGVEYKEPFDPAKEFADPEKIKADLDSYVHKTFTNNEGKFYNSFGELDKESLPNAIDAYFASKNYPVEYKDYFKGIVAGAYGVGAEDLKPVYEQPKQGNMVVQGGGAGPENYGGEPAGYQQGLELYRTWDSANRADTASDYMSQ